MSKLVLSVYEMVVKECRTTMPINYRDNSCHMVHDQQIYKEKLKEKSRKSKRAKNSDGNLSHAWYNGQGCSKFRQRFSRHGSSDFYSKLNKDWVCNIMNQEVNGGGYLLPTCANYGRKHEGKSLAGSDACVGCGKMEHKIKDYPSVAKNEEDNSQRSQPDL